MNIGACNPVHYILEIKTKLDINNIDNFTKFFYFIPNFFDRDFLRNKSFGHNLAQSPQTSFFTFFITSKRFSDV